MSTSNKPQDEPDSLTAYTTSAKIKAFDQLGGPGSDADMDPLAEHTKIELWDDEGKPYLQEYKGSEKLKGKKVIVTGGDSGIGRTVAIFAARESAAGVTISYLPAEEKDAQRTAELIRQAGSEPLLVQHDLAKGAAEAEKVIKAHVEKFGRIDVLVNNASTQIQCRDLADIVPENVEKTLQVNVAGMIFMTKYALPHMIRGGAIVNSSSVTAFKGSGGMVDYSATKGAILTFTRSMSTQLMPKGIRVNVVAPGPVYTPLQPASRQPEQMEDWGLSEKLGIRSRVGQPAELGPAYIFCMSNQDSNIMTGCTIHVNCGQMPI